MNRKIRLLGFVFIVAAFAGCGSDKIVQPPEANSKLLATLGQGPVSDRFTGEVWVRGNVAYTTTWGNRAAPGNAVKIWDVSHDVPALVDSIIVPNAVTLGDVQASDDGKLLVVATEFSPGSIMIYDLASPTHPQLITRYTTALTDPGVHTSEVQRVNGRLYAFLCIDPGNGIPARLVIVDITDPTAATQVFTAQMGSPFVHDVYVRDGYMITALWDAGIKIWDIGGGGTGTISNPIAVASLKTVGGQAHNVLWYHAASGEKKYVFVGQESPAPVGFSSGGDIHVVDVSTLTAPKEVAFYSVPGAGTHNFSVDETRGILYAAYYNGGVRALNVTGDLAACTAAQKSFDGRCDLGLMGREIGHAFTEDQVVYVWGVQWINNSVFASDMLNGLWRLAPVPFGPD